VKHILFPVDELEPGSNRSVEVEGVRIALFRTPDGEVRALRDVCPHAGARMSLGTVESMVVGSESGHYRLSEKPIVRCPWHGYEFDLDTGRCIADPDGLRMRAYPVTIEDGRIVVER
jgi:3-phenylpropionate/trans-cinnamate dioxygenase ferredoxin subunit